MRQQLIELALAVCLAFGAYQYIGHRAVESYKQEVAIEQAKVDKAQQEKYDKLSKEYETSKANRQVNTNTITKTYEKVIEKPIYSTVCIDPSGLQLANEAIAGKPSSQHNTKMPSDQTP